MRTWEIGGFESKEAAKTYIDNRLATPQASAYGEYLIAIYEAAGGWKVQMGGYGCD